MKIEKETLQESRKCIPPLLIKGIIPFWAAPGTQNVRQNNLNPPLNHQPIPPKMPQTFSCLVAKIMDFWAAIYGLIPKFLIPSLFAPNTGGYLGLVFVEIRLFCETHFPDMGLLHLVQVTTLLPLVQGGRWVFLGGFSGLEEGGDRVREFLLLKAWYKIKGLWSRWAVGVDWKQC